MRYFALTCLGNIESLGDHEDFDEADDMATKKGMDAVWIGDQETFVRWEKQMAKVKSDWNAEVDPDGNCIYCGKKCFEGQGCDEWNAGRFDMENNEECNEKNSNI